MSTLRRGHRGAAPAVHRCRRPDPLTTLGILQYVAPMTQFGLGVFAFRPMPPARLAGFATVEPLR